jgi:site-specific DNA-methyltransferase (adenine-specific)
VNEIVWYYYNKMPDTRKKIITRASDTIFWYSKNKSKYCFNLLTEKRDAPVKQLLRKKVQGKAVNARDEAGNIMYQVREERVVDNVWRISMLQPADKKERIGYPTQKPTALLERIIKAASNPGDVVLDAFMGGGTTIAVAHRHNRRFIGIDQSVQALKVSQARIEKETDLFNNNTPFTVMVHKYDYDTLRNAEHFAFQDFIVEQFEGTPNYKKVGDFGLDGVKNEDGVDVPIQVKRSDGVGRNVIDNFKSAMARFNKKCKAGYVIAFSFGKGAIEEVARLKNAEGITIKLVKVEEIIPLAKKPRISLAYEWKQTAGEDIHTDKEIAFIVTSKDNIELYQWDFDYTPEKGFKAEVLMDKEGKQTRVFTGGTHNIAVRAIDEDGIEAIEELTLIVNGGVKTST